MKALKSEYRKKKKHIEERLNEFRRVGAGANEDIFAELCFCLLTPQSRAVYCDKAVKELKREGLLLKGSEGVVKSRLKGVRFPNNKAAYLVAARKLFKSKGAPDVKSKIDAGDIFKTREWLVTNVKGLGYKEASHFLRNIGLGGDIAILDVHVLKSLKERGVIKKVPASISKKVYLETEEKMRVFSRKINIPLEALDLLFWSGETGFIFK
ncbi:MAG: N-glycosylase/DNA lyase [Candidatus Omnitrophota bacterium]